MTMKIETSMSGAPLEEGKWTLMASKHLKFAVN